MPSRAHRSLRTPPVSGMPPDSPSSAAPLVSGTPRSPPQSSERRPCTSISLRNLRIAGTRPPGRRRLSEILSAMPVDFSPWTAKTRTHHPSAVGSNPAGIASSRVTRGPPSADPCVSLVRMRSKKIARGRSGWWYGYLPRHSNRCSSCPVSPPPRTSRAGRRTESDPLERSRPHDCREQGPLPLTGYGCTSVTSEGRSRSR